jgi:hypothetical protein
MGEVRVFVEDFSDHFGNSGDQFLFLFPGNAFTGYFYFYVWYDLKD